MGSVTETCPSCGRTLTTFKQHTLRCVPCDKWWWTGMPPSQLRSDLVRCGCGAVRNDQDEPACLTTDLQMLQHIAERGDLQLPETFERPRVCRRCGCVYMLPKPVAPSGPAPGSVEG